MSRGKIVVGSSRTTNLGSVTRAASWSAWRSTWRRSVAAPWASSWRPSPVQSSNRMQFLEQGKIDLMIATMSDRPDRREIVGIVGPNYYTSGTNILAPKA